MRIHILKNFFVLLTLFALAAPATAQTTAPVGEKATTISVQPPPEEKTASVSELLANWRGTLLSTEQALARSGFEDSQLVNKSAEISTIRIEALKLENDLLPQVRQFKAQLDELGPAPKKDAPVESEEIAKKRKQLETDFARLDGELKASRLVVLRAAQIEQQLITNRRDRFVKQILQYTTSIFSIQLWSSFWNGLDGMGSRFTLLIGESISAMSSNLAKSNVIAPLLAAGLALALLIFIGIRRLGQRRYNRIAARQDGDEIGHYAKVRMAGIAFIRNGIAPAILIVLILIIFSTLGLFTKRLETLAFEIGLILALIVAALALAHVYLLPDNPARRIAHLTNSAANRIYKIIFVGVVLIGVLRLANKTAVILVSPFDVSIVFSALLALVCFVSLVLVLITIASTNDAAPLQITIRRNFIRWGYLNPLFWLTSLAGGIALITGYIAFAEFLAWQILIGAVIFALLWLAIELLDINRERYLDADSGRWQKLSHATGFSRQTVLQGSVFAFGIAKLVTLVAAATTFMISWGYRTGDWAGPITEAFFGFKIGGLSISVSSIIMALILFIGGYIITRAVQHWLRSQFLPTTSLDPGLRNSITTILGYVGIVLAALLAITAAGLDLSNLAIVAGALSVGIGFGLQSIVGNFVSGLILLAERPIKSGDWIVTTGGEGTVRKTSVRSTEIETFDGATVIIPNSTLITDAVTNWTHHDQRGRIIIPIGVDYDSDPEQVREVLMECAHAHPLVLSDPGPIVYFMDFGPSALLFELRAYLADVNISISTKSELRFTIVKALREANIKIPFPQHDIHIKTAPENLPAARPKKPARRKTIAKPKPG